VGRLELLLHMLWFQNCLQTLEVPAAANLQFKFKILRSWSVPGYGWVRKIAAIPSKLLTGGGGAGGRGGGAGGSRSGGVLNVGDDVVNHAVVVGDHAGVVDVVDIVDHVVGHRITGVCVDDVAGVDVVHNAYRQVRMIKLQKSVSVWYVEDDVEYHSRPAGTRD
jgi:hypothetical protein